MIETLWAVIQIVAGLVVLVLGGEWLVRGASRLAGLLKVAPTVIGLTVVAFGTSAPELAVSVLSGLQGKPDLAIGNVVGSNIFNVLFILGASAIIVPLTVASVFIRRDVPIMIGVSLLVWIMAYDGMLGRVDGLILLFGIVGYTCWCIYASRKEEAKKEPEITQEEPSQSWLDHPMMAVALIVGGLVLLLIGSRLLINGSVTIATMLGVSQLIVGLTIVAAGTSLPEVAASIMAALKGQRDIAVGNVIGSNIFNILCVLGLTGIVTPDGIAVQSAAWQFDFPVMIVVAVACLPIFMTGQSIARWEGFVFMFYYVAYTAHLVLNATNHELRYPFTTAMMYFVIPVTVLTIVISVLRDRSWRLFIDQPSNSAG